MNKEEFITRMYNKTYIEKQKKKVKLLGTGDKTNAYDLILVRLVTTMLLFALCFVTFDYGYFIAPVAAFV